jgi:hypothetical protein
MFFRAAFHADVVGARRLAAGVRFVNFGFNKHNAGWAKFFL